MTTTPTPPPPSAAYPPPPPPPMAPAPPRRGRNALKVGAAFVLIIGVVAAAVLLLSSVREGKKSDAKDSLRQAHALIDRSIDVSGRARRDSVKAARGSARTRRRALSELDRVVSLRKRAIAELREVEDESFAGDKSYKRVAKLMIGFLGDSIDAARDLRKAVSRAPSRADVLRAAGLSPAVEVITEEATMLRYDRAIRKAARDLIPPLT